MNIQISNLAFSKLIFDLHLLTRKIVQKIKLYFTCCGIHTFYFNFDILKFGSSQIHTRPTLFCYFKILKKENKTCFYHHVNHLHPIILGSDVTPKYWVRHTTRYQRIQTMALPVFILVACLHTALVHVSPVQPSLSIQSQKKALHH